MAINDANKGLGFFTKQLPSSSVKTLCDTATTCENPSKLQNSEEVSCCCCSEYLPTSPAPNPRYYIHLLESLSVFQVGVVFCPQGVAAQTNSAPSSHTIRGPSRNNASRNAPSAPICPMLIPEETLFPFNTDSRPGFRDNSPLSCVCV